MDTLMQNEMDHWSEMVTTPRRLVQAYRQAPWRIETQRGALLLVVAILGASVLWVMVSVTIQAASAGLEIQSLEDQQEQYQREIAGLRTRIGVQTSAAAMEKRAGDLGFKPVKPEDVTYMTIPGYKGREPVIQAPPPSANIAQPLVKPAYTQSLWEWLLQGVLQMSEAPADPQGGSSP